jgi:two-component system, OmpR family, sensor histidine kinase KdpD
VTALLNAVSHDLRTPLAAAKAAVDSLAGAADFSVADRGELVDIAVESLDRLQVLVGDILDMSRLRAGVLGVTTRPVALEEVVAQVLSHLDDDAELSVRVRLDPALPDVTADPGLLERIVDNLVRNALRYGVGRGVLVAASRYDGTVELRVADRGPGIPAADRDRVFQPFQRLDDTHNRSGLGLGLALARGLAEAMGGRLVPEDTPGGGLTMVLSLPSAAA